MSTVATASFEVSRELRMPLALGQVVYTQTTICQTKENRISIVQDTQLVKAGQQQHPSAAVTTIHQLAVKKIKGTHQIQKQESTSYSGEEGLGIIYVGSPRFECQSRRK